MGSFGAGLIPGLLGVSEYRENVVEEQDAKAHAPPSTPPLVRHILGCLRERALSKRPDCTFSLKGANSAQMRADLEIRRAGFNTPKARLGHGLYKIWGSWD